MKRNLMFALVLCAGCAGSEDDSIYGQAEQPLVQADGGYVCNAPKVLVCHIPPGNPANAHSICVGQPAVRAHQKNHGDPLGACGPTNGGGGGGAGGAGGAGGGSGGSGTGPIDAGPSCAALGASCASDADCCAGGGCSQGTCIPLID